jgi:acetyl esterase/lipase
VNIVLRREPRQMIDVYTAGADPSHPYLSPILGNLHGLPPLLFHVGSEEILLDDAHRTRFS